jgi:carbon-monoxide dehydrogenase small subunit
MNITLTINGRSHQVDVACDERLLDTLRRLEYTGVKKGCDEGTCGTCVVLMDGRAVNACVVFSASAQYTEITTIEGIGDVDHPHPIQRAFVDAGAVQCGFCTPGMVLSTKALLDRNTSPTDSDIREALDGNLCRCTGYVKILDGVRLAAKALQSKKEPGAPGHAEVSQHGGTP